MYTRNIRGQFIKREPQEWDKASAHQQAGGAKRHLGQQARAAPSKRARGPHEHLSTTGAFGTAQCLAIALFSGGEQCTAQQASGVQLCRAHQDSLELRASSSEKLTLCTAIHLGGLGGSFLKAVDGSIVTRQPFLAGDVVTICSAIRYEWAKEVTPQPGQWLAVPWPGRCQQLSSESRLGLGCGQFLRIAAETGPRPNCKYETFSANGRSYLAVTCIADIARDQELLLRPEDTKAIRKGNGNLMRSKKVVVKNEESAPHPSPAAAAACPLTAAQPAAKKRRQAHQGPQRPRKRAGRRGGIYLPQQLVTTTHYHAAGRATAAVIQPAAQEAGACRAEVRGVHNGRPGVDPAAQKGSMIEACREEIGGAQASRTDVDAAAQEGSVNEACGEEVRRADISRPDMDAQEGNVIEACYEEGRGHNSRPDVDDVGASNTLNDPGDTALSAAVPMGDASMQEEQPGKLGVRTKSVKGLATAAVSSSADAVPGAVKALKGAAKWNSQRKLIESLAALDLAVGQQEGGKMAGNHKDIAAKQMKGTRDTLHAKTAPSAGGVRRKVKELLAHPGAAAASISQPGITGTSPELQGSGSQAADASGGAAARYADTRGADEPSEQACQQALAASRTAKRWYLLGAAGVTRGAFSIRQFQIWKNCALQGLNMMQESKLLEACSVWTVDMPRRLPLVVLLYLYDHQQTHPRSDVIVVE